MSWGDMEREEDEKKKEKKKRRWDREWRKRFNEEDTSREEDRKGEFYMSNQHKERLYSYDNSQQVKDASANK